MLYRGGYTTGMREIDLDGASLGEGTSYLDWLYSQPVHIRLDHMTCTHFLVFGDREVNIQKFWPRICEAIWTDDYYHMEEIIAEIVEVAFDAAGVTL